jgi:hypothetical protein
MKEATRNPEPFHPTRDAFFAFDDRGHRRAKKLLPKFLALIAQIIALPKHWLLC